VKEATSKTSCGKGLRGFELDVATWNTPDRTCVLEGIAASASRNDRFLGRARTTEVLASSMPSGSNPENGHVRTKRLQPGAGRKRPNAPQDSR
jgi:hypothetical protein